MSKRWKVRKLNAAKREKSREVLEQFYDNVIRGLEEMKKQIEPAVVPTSAPLNDGKALG